MSNNHGKEISPSVSDEKLEQAIVANDMKQAGQDGKALEFDKDGNAVLKYDKQAERKLQLKIDMHIVPPVFLIYLWCFMDRASIGNARLAGLEQDLGMEGLDYNIALTVFYVTYTLFEIPSQMCNKYFGPGKWLPFCTFGFGIITTLTIYVKSFDGLIAARFFLGAAESVMLPGIAYYMSRWYRKDELAFRLSLYILASPLAGAFGGLLAAAILTMDKIGWITEWRMIFFVEGIITVGVAIIAFFTMADSPATARWLTEEEKALAAFRIKSENIGSTHTIDKLNRKAIKAGMMNINMIGIAIEFFFNCIMVQGLAVFLPTIVRSLYPDSSTIQLQLKTVPPNIVGAVFTVGAPFVSWRIHNRGYPLIVLGVLMIVSYIMFVASRDNNVRYAAAFICCAGAFPGASLYNAWTSNNTSPDSARAVAIACVGMMGNLGGLVSCWTFTNSTAPDYLPGNGLNLGGSIVITSVSIGLIAYQKWENGKRRRGERDYRLEEKTPEEIAMLGHHHPQFYYVH